MWFNIRSSIPAVSLFIIRSTTHLIRVGIPIIFIELRSMHKFMLLADQRQLKQRKHSKTIRLLNKKEQQLLQLNGEKKLNDAFITFAAIKCLRFDFNSYCNQITSHSEIELLSHVNDNIHWIFNEHALVLYTAQYQAHLKFNVDWTSKEKKIEIFLSELSEFFLKIVRLLICILIMNCMRRKENIERNTLDGARIKPSYGLGSSRCSKMKSYEKTELIEPEKWPLITNDADALVPIAKLF